jgi:N-acetylneuraminate synthase
MLEICAELSCNHLGSFDRAMQIAEAAAASGADLFKVQVWEPGTMCVDKAYTLTSGPWAGRRLVELYEEAWTPWEWLPPLFARCRELGMEPFGAAFDRASVDYLDDLGAKRHKVASFELTDLPLIEYMASKGKPMLMSTGMANIEERFEAWNRARTATLLRCVSAYPSRPEDVALSPWPGAKWGLSDHSLGIGVAAAAAALAACYVEKHLTLRRSDGGLDSAFSLEPAEFRLMVDTCRQAHAAVQPRSGPPKGEDRSLRRSLWVVKDTPKGAPLTLGDNIRTARPALGMPPSTPLEGTVAPKDLKAGSPLTEVS